MGYRHRLGVASKAQQIAISHITEAVYDALRQNPRGDAYQELIGDGCALYYPHWHTQLYELGKYVDTKAMQPYMTPFYSFDLTPYEAEFWVLSKDGLLALIEDYRNEIHQYYETLLRAAMDAIATGDRVPLEGLAAHFQHRVWEWEGKYVKPYYLDQVHKDGDIVSSWKKDYAIYNLVSIYQKFDWENDLLILSGW